MNSYSRISINPGTTALISIDIRAVAPGLMLILIRLLLRGKGGGGVAGDGDALIGADRGLAMLLGNFQCQGILVWIIVGQGHTVLAVLRCR